ncbi:MAG: hypothetical protein ACMG6S_24995 [Byssovorax sp.]
MTAGALGQSKLFSADSATRVDEDLHGHGAGELLVPHAGHRARGVRVDLERWLERAVIAASVAEVLDDPS